MKNWKWIDFDNVTSTNDVALEMTKENTQQIVITAKNQSKARGRRGNKWECYDGNLFLSQIISFDKQNLGMLSLITSLSIWEAINSLNPTIQAKLKWPNDVLIEGKKISGILIEKGENNKLVIGIGVNIENHPENSVKYETSSLQKCGIDVDRVDFMKIYLERFDKNIKKDKLDIIKKWQKYAFKINQEVEIRIGNTIKKGTFAGIESNGGIILENKNGYESIFAGEVFYL